MQPYAFGVDLGGTTVKIGFFRNDGSLVEKWEIPTRKENNGSAILPDIADSILAYLKKREVSSSEVEGVGIAVPGAVLEDGTVNRCVNLGWDVHPVSSELSSLLGGIRVSAGNDANAAALGEMHHTGKWNNIVLLTLGTGIGGGVVLNGEIVPGAFGAAGEIGHLPVREDETEACSCGKKGCLEQYVSAEGIVRLAKKRLNETRNESRLRTVCPLTAKDVFDEAREGDAFALSLVDEIGRILGRALAVVACVTDPDAFLIGGGISKAGAVLIEAIQRSYKKYAFHASRETIIETASLGNDAGMYGAVHLILT